MRNAGVSVMIRTRSWGLFAALLLLTMLLSGVCRADGFDGIWRSLGYGQVLEISGETVTVYQEVGGRVLPSRVEIAHRAGTRFEFEIVPWGYRSTFEMARAGDMLALSERDTGREFLFERLQELLPVTSRTDDPEVNLEYFLQLFADLYPAFEDRAVDWPAASRRLRSEFSADLAEEDLYELLSRGLDAIGEDGHIGINGPGDNRYSPATPFASPMIRSPRREERRQLIREKYIDDSVSETANGNILYGWAEPGIGYIEVQAVESLSPDPALSAQHAAMEVALQELWNFFRHARGLILDVRLNGGGFDALALMIAGLFADQEHVAFSKRARIQGTDRLTEPRLFLVEPRAQNLSDIPLRLLTGPGTASGAEILVMAMMQFPQSRRLGEPTMGILSDTYIRELPNGWTVRLYSERYFTFDGGAWEATGIPPDRFVPFTEEHLDANQDPVLEAALAELAGHSVRRRQ